MTGVLRLLAAATATATCGVAALAVAAPATARTGRRPLPVLRDVAPVGTPHVKDLVLTGAARGSRVARAARPGRPGAGHGLPDGGRDRHPGHGVAEPTRTRRWPSSS